jgi:hypothetical protein
VSRRLFLHIGYPKTGTTAIQESLFLSRDKLVDFGLLYPATGLARFSHHQFPWVLTGDERRDARLTADNLFETLQSELESSAPETDTVISSEGFIFALPPEKAENYFRRLFDEIVLVVYVRQPMRWIQSDYNQGVKGFRRLTCSFEEHVERVASVKKSPLDYHDRLSKWADVFGWDSIRMRSFDVCKDDILKSFFEILGKGGLCQEMALPERDSNPRLDFRMLELVRIINTLDIDSGDREKLINDAQRSFRQNASDDGRSLSCSKQVRQSLQRFNKNNRKLLKYFEESIFESDFFSLVEEQQSFDKQIDVEGLGDIIKPLIDLQLHGHTRHSFSGES